MELVASGTNGGAQEHVAALLDGLDRERFDIRVVTLSGGSSVARWRATGLPVHVIPETADGAMATEVADLLASWETQVVHAHMYQAEVVGAQAVSRLPVRSPSRPWLIGHIHSSRVRSASDQATLRALDPSFDRLIAVSRAIEAKIRSERPSSAPTSLIYNGVDPHRFTPSGRATDREADDVPSGPLIGCVARLEPEKGHETLLRAWPAVVGSVPDARLMLVGEGSRSSALRAQVEALGLTAGRIEFSGRRGDIPALMDSFDIVVLPSYREAQGLAVLEAMAAGCPVVASRVGGVVEMVQHGVSGLLVRPGDPDALAVALLRLLRDPDTASRLGQAGRAVAVARFDGQRMLTAIAGLYEEGAAARERPELAVRPMSA